MHCHSIHTNVFFSLRISRLRVYLPFCVDPHSIRSLISHTATSHVEDLVPRLRRVCEIVSSCPPHCSLQCPQRAATSISALPSEDPTFVWSQNSAVPTLVRFHHSALSLLYGYLVRSHYSIVSLYCCVTLILYVLTAVQSRQN